MYKILIIDMYSNNIVAEYENIHSVSHKATSEVRFDGKLKEAVNIYGNTWTDISGSVEDTGYTQGFKMQDSQFTVTHDELGVWEDEEESWDM